jgi:hypothetical protein
MEPKDKHANDILDTVIADSLRQNMGAAGPSRAVWGRILEEIAPQPEPAKFPHRRHWLRDWLQGPVGRTAFIFAVLLLVVGKPVLNEYTRVAHRAAYPDVTVVLPTVPQQRPLPEQDVNRPDPAAAALRTERLEQAREVGVPLPQLRFAESP